MKGKTSVNKKGLTMKRKIVCGLIVFLGISVVSLDAYAKTSAWLINSAGNKAQKLDVDANKIIQTIVPKELRSSIVLQPDWKDAIVTDTGSNLLFVIYDYPGRFMGQGVKIYNLKDLSFKKDLGITSKDQSLELPKLIVPPVGNKFYVIWWDSTKATTGQSGKTYSVYDKTTLNKISDLASFPIDFNLFRPLMFSLDGSKIYSINIDTNEIKVYDSLTLELKETISIANIWGQPAFLKRVVAETGFLGRGNKIFFMENIKGQESDPHNIKYFVYSIPTKEISNKISIREDGVEVLSPNASKIIINETLSVQNEFGTITGIKHLNRIYIYDVASGLRVKYLDLSTQYKGTKIAGISPDSFKLYLAAGNIQTGNKTIIVVDLKDTLSVIAEIPVEGTWWMIFFEE